MVTDGNSLTGTDQFRKVNIERMVRKPCYHKRFSFSIFCVIAFAERDSKYFGCFLCIVAVSFIEVSTSEEQNCIRMLRF